MSILFCMALLAAAADDSVDLSNPFIGDNVGEGVAMDEFAVAPAATPSVVDRSAIHVSDRGANSDDTTDVPPDFDLPFQCGSAPVMWTSADFPQPMDGNRPKPEWLGQPLVKTGDVHSIAVSSPPMITEIEAREALDKAILNAVRKYVDDQVGRIGAGRRVHITMDDVDSFGMETDRYMQNHRFVRRPDEDRPFALAVPPQLPRGNRPPLERARRHRPPAAHGADRRWRDGTADHGVRIPEIGQ